MAHHHYDTEGFILGHLDLKESSRLLYLLTKNFGLVLALAEGVREPRSKMRANLQDFTSLRAGLVRGREFWRLTSAEELSWFSQLSQLPETRAIVARIFSLIRRLVPGEESDARLFEDLETAFRFLVTERPCWDEEDWLINYELSLVGQVLRRLGYLKTEPLLTSFLDFQQWQSVPDVAWRSLRPKLIATINQSLASSQL